MISAKRDSELMRRALELSKDSRPEADSRVHPLVGAVVVRPDGEIISEACRGQHTPGNHAEQEALVNIREDRIHGAVVYSTLEPCTIRGTQTPCFHRLLDMQVSEVVIGMLDPNRDIRGRAWWKFEERGVKVRNFQPEIVQEIRHLNRAFIDYQLGPGIIFADLQPEGRDRIVVSSAARNLGEAIKVPQTESAVRYVANGSYRVRPMPGDTIVAFVRRRALYYPQAPINWTPDGSDPSLRSWSAQFYARATAADSEAEFIIARLSRDLAIIPRHYSWVYERTKEWVPFQMPDRPPGFEVLASLTLRGAV